MSSDSPSTASRTTPDQRQAALDYHEFSRPGKIEIRVTKRVATQDDLALAYSPGVGYACEAIVDDPGRAHALTARGNLVAVVTNGTAVLGLGNIGPLAGKPVMEGKSVLFKRFAGVDAFDIELDANDPDKLVEIVAAMEPTFGGINLEDIKAPECFAIERALRERMKIPVFHDDQHGTAIVVGAAVSNALHIVGKAIEDATLVVCGMGAAGVACVDMLVSLGLKRGNVLAVDRSGVIHSGRQNLDPSKAAYARDTDKRTLAEALEGADIFLGLSGPGTLTPDMLKTMAASPIVLALANPYPEILPDDARAVRPDALVGTGRSDFPNQINNVLCFPYLFRGALDVGASQINTAMKVACVNALARLAREHVDAEGRSLFGPDRLIPHPLDTELLVELPAAVAQAAIDSGVATRPLHDLDQYRERLRALAESLARD
ncbi:malic enzyme-like NAD(P)-binding protein [Pseudomonas sp. Hp2]|uniref:malic enzyme-like NAD(P)-binding protein n=1 Tax=Pseudomonas sp. Hp2 TaxID=701189 RepID=UPI00112E1A21|nr:malic enzyme-like NAD(P)-binding protein [Pseudomonas sp. Hp2]